jgi:hypothetical protein
VVERVSHSSKAARGEDVQVEHPVWCGYTPAFHFHPTLIGMKIRGHFHNENCLKCPHGMPRFAAVQSPQSVRVLLEKSAMRGLNCHGQAHPARQQRTPGSADSTQRMEAVR